MLINKVYVQQRAKQLIKEKQDTLESSKLADDKYYDIKQRFPKFLRNIIFNPLNPFYSVFVQYKASKRKKKNQINLRRLHPFALDFFEYCMNNDFNFETELYFPEIDELTIESFVDNRLKSLIAGYDQICLDAKQLAMFDQRQFLLDSTKETKDGYCLTLNDINYYLPKNTFEEHTYIHEYGLVYLPDYVKEYIKDKVFLDVGSYLGDTAIMLLNKYEPKQIYAYEPIDTNAKQVEKTILQNKTDKITLVQKGLGEKNAMLDVYVDPNKLSASSINNTASENNSVKKQIEIATIDAECKNLNIGLIKMDIEGAEYGAIKGGLETIKRDKPVLLISVYHTGKDFFEIPPMLKEAVPDYLFRLIDLEISSPITEKILVAYPKK